MTLRYALEKGESAVKKSAWPPGARLELSSAETWPFYQKAGAKPIPLHRRQFNLDKDVWERAEA